MTAFVKYQGTGNDFILIDDRGSSLDLQSEVIRKLCDRHFGIGADGLILIRNCDGFDFQMLYYNSDGLPGSMCGNGGRCAVSFANSLGIIKKRHSFLAVDGPHKAEVLSEIPFLVKLQMGNVNNIELHSDYIFLNTGSPHYVLFVDDVNEVDVLSEGRKIRYNERFIKDGTNVNFVHQENGALYVRTYERGVENETLSCGTGVTASVLAAAFSGKGIFSGYPVITPGGELKVYFKKEVDGYSDIWLEGPVERVFDGEIKIL